MTVHCPGFQPKLLAVSPFEPVCVKPLVDGTSASSVDAGALASGSLTISVSSTVPLNQGSFSCA